jgi:glutathione reductase (NADPH)
VGGGYIGVEFAGIFRGFGCEVTQVVRGPRILRGFDEDVRAFLSEEMRKQGIALRCETGVHSVTRGREGLTVTLSDDERVEVDTVLMATGRVANTSGLGLENAGVATDESGSILVDAHLSTNVPGIWACGDVINRIQLTPVALAEGMALAHALFGEGSSPPDIDYTTIPTAVFSRPPVGTVGLTEAAARERGAEVDVYRSTFRPMKHTLSGRDERALMKLIVDRETDRVLGCHVVADEAGEILQGIAVAVRQGITKRELDRTIGIHPTAAEELVTMRTPVS